MLKDDFNNSAKVFLSELLPDFVVDHLRDFIGRPR